MYAVIATGGKQYKVREGEVLRVEKLYADEGSTVDFYKVLLVASDEDLAVGAHYIDGSKVSAEIRAHGRGKKIEIIKFKRRKHHRKQMGHRQSYTELLIKNISK